MYKTRLILLILHAFANGEQLRICQVRKLFLAKLSQFRAKVSIVSKDQRTNGPVNAHLRSATYANKHV